MCYHHRIISTWVQYEKSIAAWIHHINNNKILAPGRPPFLTLHHPLTIEASTCSYKHCTQLDSLPSKTLHNIGIWYLGTIHCNKLKSVLVRLTQHHPVLCAYISCKNSNNPQLINACIKNTSNIFGRKTPWPSQIQPHKGKGTDYQTWARLTPHDHSRKFNPVNVSPVS